MVESNEQVSEVTGVQSGSDISMRPQKRELAYLIFDS